MRNIFLFGLTATLIACEAPQTDIKSNPQDAFFDNLSQLCGNSYNGKVTSADPQDEDWIKEVLTIHIRDCSETEIKIPLHVGANRSRTWIISKTDTGLSLKHDHRHEDGEPDAVSLYGGDTATKGTALEQAFPVDDFSKELFRREGLEVSMTNVWTVTLDPGQTFTYGLKRENRDFKAQIDLTKTVNTPPPAWGSE